MARQGCGVSTRQLKAEPCPRVVQSAGLQAVGTLSEQGPWSPGLEFRLKSVPAGHPRASSFTSLCRFPHP